MISIPPKNIRQIGHTKKYDIYECYSPYIDTTTPQVLEIWHYSGIKKEDWFNPIFWEKITST